MDSLENDNVYPNAGARFFTQVPKEQQKSLKEEIEQTLNQLPVLEEVVKHLDEQIAFFGSLDSIKVDLDKDPLTFQKEHAANSLAKAKLEAERSYILARVERAIKR